VAVICLSVGAISFNTFRLRRYHKLKSSRDLFNLLQVFFLLIPARNREHVIGDLEEEYCASNKRLALLWYWIQVISLVINYRYVALKHLLGLDVVRKLIRK